MWQQWERLRFFGVSLSIGDALFIFDKGGGRIMADNKLITLDFGEKSCAIMPFDSQIDPSVMVGYEKIPVSLSQRSQISALCSQIK